MYNVLVVLIKYCVYVFRGNLRKAYFSARREPSYRYPASCKCQLFGNTFCICDSKKLLYLKI